VRNCEECGWPEPCDCEPERSAGSLERLVRLLVANHTPEELALGYLRYEAVRKMSPRTFGELHKLNLSGKFFDSLVDEALQSWKQPNDKLRHGGETTK